MKINWGFLKRKAYSALFTLSALHLYAYAAKVDRDEDINNVDEITGTTVFYSKEEFDKTYQDLKASIDVIWIITATINILLMQIGFLFLEVGQVHEKNKTNLLISNLIDTFIAAVSYYTIGFAFANDALGGLIGNGPFFLLGLDLRGLLRWVF